MYSLLKTLAQLKTYWIVEQFFFSYAFRVTIKRTRTASQQLLRHKIQYYFLMAESASGKDES